VSCGVELDDVATPWRSARQRLDWNTPSAAFKLFTQWPHNINGAAEQHDARVPNCLNCAGGSKRCLSPPTRWGSELPSHTPENPTRKLERQTTREAVALPRGCQTSLATAS